MEKIAVCKAKKLAAPVRKGIESLLGRKLQEEEEVAVMAFAPHPAPPANVRQVVMSKLEKIMDQAGESSKEVPERKMQESIDEAMTQVRRWEQ